LEKGQCTNNTEFEYFYELHQLPTPQVIGSCKSFNVFLVWQQQMCIKHLFFILKPFIVKPFIAHSHVSPTVCLVIKQQTCLCEFPSHQRPRSLHWTKLNQTFMW